MTTSGIRKLPAGIISDTGDVDGDTYGDIVIGARWDADVPSSQKGGVVTVVHGTASGPVGNMAG
ncbi:hypothetical protein ACWD4L_15685 [Streptomyces sp. NPDC002596]